MLSDHVGKKIDLIVMPEGAVPLDAAYPCIDSRFAQFLVRQFFPGQPEDPISDRAATNSTFCHTLTHLMETDLIIGLIARDEERIYNAALHFSPGKEEPEQYRKQVLFPFAEAIPYAWMSRISERYGIVDSFTKGEGATLFSSPFPIGATICYEE